MQYAPSPSCSALPLSQYFPPGITSQYQLLRPLSFGAEQLKDLLALSSHGIKDLVGVYLDNWVLERAGLLKCSWDPKKEPPVNGGKEEQCPRTLLRHNNRRSPEDNSPRPGRRPALERKGNRPPPGRKQKAKG